MPRPWSTDVDSLRDRAIGATVDLLGGTIDTKAWWAFLIRASDHYLGPPLGMSPFEAFERMSHMEWELLAEALEERAAFGCRAGDIVEIWNDRNRKTPKGNDPGDDE